MNLAVRRGLARQLRDHLFVVSCLLILTVSWSLSTGRYGGPDEPSHVIRASAVADGDVTGRAASGMDDGFRLVTVPIALGSGDPACYRHDPRATPACAAPAAAPDTVTVATAAGTYPPHYYAIVGGAARLVGGADDPMAYRIASDVVVSLVLGHTLVRLRRWRSRPAALLFIGSLPPSTWFLFGVVNPNSVEIALVALAWACVVEFLSDRDVAAMRPLAAAAWAFATAVLLRPVAILTAPTIVVVLAMCASPAQRAALWRRRPLATTLAPVIGAVVITGAWHLVAPAATSDARTSSTRSFGDALSASLDGTVETVREIVGSLGWLEFVAPNVAQLGWWIVVAVSFAAAATAGVRSAAVFTIAALTVVTMPVVFELVMYDRVGFIWQGRYSIAAAVGVVAVGAVALATAPARHDRMVRTVCRCVPGITAVTLVVTHWAVARRYTVGVDGPWDLSDAGGWRPQLDPWLLIGLGAAAIAGLATWWQLIPDEQPSDDVAEDVDDDVGRPGEVEDVDAATGPQLHVGQVGHR